MKRFLTLFLALNCLSVQAKWYEVSSDHFVIYADQSPKAITKFAERLELFHDAMNLWYGREDLVPSPSNRVTIYVVGSERKVRKLHGSDSRFVAGFYIPRAGGSIAVVPKITNAKTATANNGFILYHEYAHHYQIMLDSFAYPRWLREGFAEFFAGVRFEHNGDLGVGIPAYHRAYSLATAKKIPVQLLLDTAAYEEKRKKMPGWKYDSFYGRSWALFHMLQFSKERKGQFGTYVQALQEGQGELKSAELAFGDLEALEKELREYLKKSHMVYLPISADKLNVGDLKIRKLRKGEAVVMPLRIEIRTGITRERANELVEELLPFTEEYPDEALVWETIAEASIDAGLKQEGLNRAEKAIEINDDSVFAKILKGYAMEQIAKDTPGANVSWKKVRSQFIKANRQEPDNPIPLVKFYESYINEKITPTENSKGGLMRALQLAPYDNELRWMVAAQLIQDQQYEAGIRVLSPIANHPHSPKMATAAREFIAEAEQLLASKTTN